MSTNSLPTMENPGTFKRVTLRIPVKGGTTDEDGNHVTLCDWETKQAASAVYLAVAKGYRIFSDSTYVSICTDKGEEVAYLLRSMVSERARARVETLDLEPRYVDPKEKVISQASSAALSMARTLKESGMTLEEACEEQPHFASFLDDCWNTLS